MWQGAHASTPSGGSDENHPEVDVRARADRSTAHRFGNQGQRRVQPEGQEGRRVRALGHRGA